MNRITRLLRIFLSVALVAVFTLDVTLAWIYVRALTHPGCPGTPDPLPGFPAPQEVILESGDTQLRAWYYPSRNRAAVIALGGMGGALGERLPPVRPLVEAGYGVLQLDTRACADPPVPVTLGYREADDALAGLAFLQRQPEVAPARIGVMGFSMGGAAAIQAAARSAGLAAVVAEGGYHNLGDDIVERGSRQPPLQQAFLYTIAAVFWLQTGVNPWASSPIERLPAISPRPVLLIYGEDELVSGRGEQQYQAAVEPKTLWVVPGGGHGTNHLAAPSEYARRVLDFFDLALAGPTAAGMP